MKFLLERFYSLTAYTRLILLGSLAAAWVLILVWVFLSAGKKRTRH